MKVWVIILLACLFAGFPASLSGQREWQETCPNCEIALELVAELGGEDDEGYVGEFTVVSRSSEHYFIRDLFIPGEVKVFDLQGRFVANLGREGEGPGEFRGGSAMQVSRGDSLLLIDTALQRLSVFGPDLELARSWQTPFSPEDQTFISFEDGSLLFTGSFGSRDLVGIPHHHFDRQGNRLTSFGDPVGRYSPGGNQFLRFLARSTGNSVWVAHHEEYRLTRWTLSGERLAQLNLFREWFEEASVETSIRSQRPTYAPRSSIQGISEDAEGLLWVVGTAPDLDWEGVVGPEGRTGNSVEVYDSMVEVLDPASESLIASRRFTEGVIWGFLDSNHVYGTTFQGPSPRAAVWRISLARRAHPMN